MIFHFLNFITPPLSFWTLLSSLEKSAATGSLGGLYSLHSLPWNYSQFFLQKEICFELYTPSFLRFLIFLQGQQSPWILNKKIWGEGEKETFPLCALRSMSCFPFWSSRHLIMDWLPPLLKFSSLSIKKTKTKLHGESIFIFSMTKYCIFQHLPSHCSEKLVSDQTLLPNEAMT